jgi:hypothetical protein
LSETQSMISLLFVSPKTYSEMLRKLAGLTALEVFLTASFLRLIPPVGSEMRQLEAYIIPISQIKGFEIAKLNPFGFACALLVAFLFYHLQLHNKIEKLFGIRERFDVEKIILPLASLVGVSLSDAQKVRIRSERHSVMRQVFYKYASSSGADTLVDSHDIERALEGWTKFWASEEAAVVFSAGLIVSLAFHELVLIFIFLGLVVFCLIAMVRMGPSLDGRARAQIEQIASDATARHDVSQYLNAL